MASRRHAWLAGWRPAPDIRTVFHDQHQRFGASACLAHQCEAALGRDERAQPEAEDGLSNTPLSWELQARTSRDRSSPLNASWLWAIAQALKTVCRAQLPGNVPA